LSEEGEGAFGEVAESGAIGGGVGVEGGGLFGVAGCFGEVGLACGEGVWWRGVRGGTPWVEDGGVGRYLDTRTRPLGGSEPLA
jgi:hypothetical protein